MWMVAHETGIELCEDLSSRSRGKNIFARAGHDLEGEAKVSELVLLWLVGARLRSAHGGQDGGQGGHRHQHKIICLCHPTMAALSEPPQAFVDGAALDYFMMEMVTTLKASAAVATARAKKIEQEMVEAGLVPPSIPAPPPLPLKKESARDSVTSLTSKSGSKAVVDEDEEALRSRLEYIGSHVGANITEKYSLLYLLPHVYLFDFLDYVAIEECFLTRLTSSNSFAKTSGPRFGINKLIIYEQITEYAPHTVCETGLLTIPSGNLRPARQSVQTCDTTLILGRPTRSHSTSQDRKSSPFIVSHMY